MLQHRRQAAEAQLMVNHGMDWRVEIHLME